MPSTPTYTLINQVTLATASPQVLFSSIPQSFRDLILVIEASTTESGVTLDIRFNGDAGTNYTAVEMGGRANGAYSGAGTSEFFRVLGNTFGTAPFQCTMQIMDYSQIDKHKTVLARAASNDTSLSSTLVKGFAGRWPNTIGVNTISVASLFNSRNFASGSRFSLYGIVG